MKVVIGLGENGCLGRKRVECFPTKSRYFVINKNVDAEGVWFMRQYSVTHKRTGLAAAKVTSKRAARKIAVALEAIPIKWDKITAKNAHAYWKRLRNKHPQLAYWLSSIRNGGL